jgi:hypothetical protein
VTLLLTAACAPQFAIAPATPEGVTMAPMPSPFVAPGPPARTALMEAGVVGVKEGKGAPDAGDDFAAGLRDDGHVQTVRVASHHPWCAVETVVDLPFEEQLKSEEIARSSCEDTRWLRARVA